MFNCILVNTASISILFEHNSYFELNQCVIHCSFLYWYIQLQFRYFYRRARVFKEKWTFYSLIICLGKCSFPIDNFLTHLVNSSIYITVFTNSFSFVWITSASSGVWQVLGKLRGNYCLWVLDKALSALALSCCLPLLIDM